MAEPLRRPGWWLRWWLLLVVLPGVLDASVLELLPSPDPDPFDAERTLETRPLAGMPSVVARRLMTLPLPDDIAPGTRPGGGSLIFAPATTVLPAATGGLDIPWVLEIDGLALLPAVEGGAATLELYLYALALDGPRRGEVVGHSAEAFDLEPAVLEEAMAVGGLKVHGRLWLDPGRYQLRFLLRRPRDGAEGWRVLELAGPELAAQEITAQEIMGTASESAPWVGWMVPEPVGRWWTVRGNDWQRAESAYPLVSEGRVLVPAADPVLWAEHGTELVLYGSGLAPGPWQVVVTLWSPRGVPLELELGVVELGEEPFIRFPRLRLPRLASGRHVMGLALVGPRGEKRVTAPRSEIWVLRGERPERGLLWVDLRHLLLAPEGAEPALVDKPRRRGRKKGAGAMGEYRALLVRLARSGERGSGTTRWQEIVEGLRRLESSALVGEGDPLAALVEAQETLAEALGADDPEALLPLLELHLRAYRLYLRRGSRRLVGHARGRVAALALRYAEHGAHPSLAADALAVLAGELQDTGLHALAAGFYHDALRIDPAHRGARLALVVIHQRVGDRQAALDHLGRLLQHHPDDPEALLRSAVEELRRGRRLEARARLESLRQADEVPRWIALGARIELARLLLETAEAALARHVLEEALVLHPEAAEPRYLLAHLDNRAGRTASARALLEPLKTGGDEGERSVGRRYDDWPRSVMATAEARLVTAAEAHLATLGEALGLETGEGGDS